MSELKAIHVVDAYDDYLEHPCEECSQVYLKSEADKAIAELKDIDSKNRSAYYKDLAMMAKDVEHHKYKQCLAMAKYCKEATCYFEERLDKCSTYWRVSARKAFYERWHKRWLELAEKFKEAKRWLN